MARRRAGDRICLSGLGRTEVFIYLTTERRGGRGEQRRGGGDEYVGLWRQRKIKMMGKKERKLETRDFADGWYRKTLVNSSSKAKTWSSINGD